MRIAIYQFSTIWMNHVENLNQVDDVCNEISGKVDLLVLPEMFNTGYTMTPDEIPEDWQTETINRLIKISSVHDLVICGSIPLKKEHHWYNTFIFLSEKGVLYTYDKIHLFTPAGEKKSYSSGNAANFFDLNGWKVMPLICYDLRFPYLTFGNENPDIIMFSANWPDTRIEHWKALLRARAIENQCYVIGTNRTGTDLNGYQYPGASMIYNFNGDVITEMDSNPGYAIVTISLEPLIENRKKLPFLNDRKSNFICKVE